MSDRVIEVFADVLNMPPESLNDATSPSNTQTWDSLASVNLTVAIEIEFGVKLRTQDVMAMNSIGAAKSVLRTKGVDLA